VRPPPLVVSPPPRVEPAGAPVPLPTRSVQLVIVPGDADVEHDGEKVAAHDGIVDIKGTLGSVHEVRMTKGTSSKTGQIAVTDSGANPPKLELSTKPGAPVAPAKATAAPDTTATPNAKKQPAGIVNSFD
ncbi:MAG TPA: serine/threonine protein kinase, partial [Minicystis sp.]|nr:serine/threonine protein kinase [Minicystis sp.]